jgi:hypothetical protein
MVPSTQEPTPIVHNNILLEKSSPTDDLTFLIHNKTANSKEEKKKIQNKLSN